MYTLFIAACYCATRVYYNYHVLLSMFTELGVVEWVESIYGTVTRLACVVVLCALVKLWLIIQWIATVYK